jgi:hypothetical protein
MAESNGFTVKVKVSATVQDHLAAGVRAIAQREKRSVSNVIERSLNVFEMIPKEIRDLIIELNAVNNEPALQRLHGELTSLARQARKQMDVRD